MTAGNELLLTVPWKKEFQQRPDAFSPGVFAVLATFDFAILKVYEIARKG